MKNKIQQTGIYILLIFSIFNCYSQETKKIPLTYQSTLVGIGATSVYDSYLSPLQYTGWNIGMIEEEIKMTRLLNGKVSAQHLLHTELALAQNPSKTATDYAGNVEYGYGLHYRFQTRHKLLIGIGLQANGLLGVVYNSRNGNNPVNVKTDAGLNVSGMAAYRFQIKKQPVHVRYQINLPLAGVVFSPEYGQSYYEIGLGAGDNLFHFASFHNRLAVRNLISVELPFNSSTVRLAYMHWWYETRINALHSQFVSGAVYVGMSKNFHIVSGKKQNKNQYQSVFE